MHLSINNNLAPDTRYCALSHCWGNPNYLPQLTSENFDDLRKEISLLDLPKTYRDAITIARSLGQRYIWIDSLCIMQDSEDDWTREAAAMGAVYENSVCTIAAVGASDTDMGCFDVRNPLTYTSCEVPGTTNDGCYIRRLGDEHMYDTVTRKFPLLERAWAVQENLLSPRMLYFTEQMFWSCRQGHATERFFEGWGESANPWAPQRLSDLRPIFGHNDARPFKKLTDFHWRSRGRSAYSAMRATKILSTQSEHNIVHKLWFEVVRYYSQGKLTKPSDKLVALSGVAERVQEATKLRYLAGLWKETLPLDLLWYVVRPYDRGITNYERPSEYRAPTWSWASVDGEIRTLNRRYTLKYHENEDKMDKLEPAFEVVSVEVTTSELDTSKTGQVLRASLTIHGTLRGISFLETRLESWETRKDHGGICFFIQYGNYDCAEIYLDTKMDLDLREVFFFTVVQPHNPQGFNIDSPIWQAVRYKGLVLVSMGNFYERVGIFRINKVRCGGFPFGEWEKWVNSGKRETIVIH
jgi:hypothetical protein